MYAGKKVESENPWEANTLEWSTPIEPGHGNWPGELPEVHHWPYDFNHPDEKEDFTPQWVAPRKVGAK